MSNKLKLTGIMSYMSPLLANVHILRGDVIKVSDEVAGKIGGLNRPSDNDGITIFFFTEAKAGEAVTYDFTQDTPPQQKAPAEVIEQPAPKLEPEDLGEGVLSDSGAEDAKAFEQEPEQEPEAPAAAVPEAVEAVARPVQRKRAAATK